MKILRVLGAACALLAACGGTLQMDETDAGTSLPSGVGVPAPSSVWVTGYYAGYQASMYPAAKVDFSAMTHLAVGAIVPRADGTLDQTFYIDAVNGPALASDLARRAHAAGRKAIV